MLFTWDTNNLCIVFSQWRVTGTFSLVISILAERIESSPRNTAEAEEKKGKVVKAALYGIQVFYSFFIMLLFMTYNGWIMLAVGFGAFFGYLIFGQASIDKSAACH